MAPLAKFGVSEHLEGLLLFLEFSCSFGDTSSWRQPSALCSQGGLFGACFCLLVASLEYGRQLFGASLVSWRCI